MNARRDYEVVVVGAGPAGLSAARTAARLGFKTLVLERLAAPGALGHPCSAIIAPVPRSASSLAGGTKAEMRSRPASHLYFRKLDLTIPAGLVKGYSTQQHWLSPNGFAIDAALSGRKDYPAAVVDKPGLLRLLADQASLAGAELRFGTVVTGLVREDDRVAGVRTAEGEIRAEMVLSAEGITRELCSSVLPFQRIAGPERFGLIISQELAAPAVGPAQVGQYITLGRRYTSARNAFGMLVAPAPGRLSVYFCLFADSPHHYTERSAHFYVQEYMDEDPRVRDLCRGADLLSQDISRTLAGSAPARVTMSGFMGLGDAITPAAYLGILPAVYLGRQAALIASEAIDAGDRSPARLRLFEHIVRERMLPDLKSEYRLLANLADMPDDALDRFCQGQRCHPTALPFSVHARAIEWATVGGRSAPHAATRLPLPQAPAPALLAVTA